MEKTRQLEISNFRAPKKKKSEKREKGNEKDIPQQLEISNFRAPKKKKSERRAKGNEKDVPPQIIETNEEEGCCSCCFGSNEKVEPGDTYNISREGDPTVYLVNSKDYNKNTDGNTARRNSNETPDKRTPKKEKSKDRKLSWTIQEENSKDRKLSWTSQEENSKEKKQSSKTTEENPKDWKQSLKTKEEKSKDWNQSSKTKEEKSKDWKQSSKTKEEKSKDWKQSSKTKEEKSKDKKQSPKPNEEKSKYQNQSSTTSISIDDLGWNYKNEPENWFRTETVTPIQETTNVTAFNNSGKNRASGLGKNSEYRLYKWLSSLPGSTAEPPLIAKHVHHHHHHKIKYDPSQGQEPEVGSSPPPVSQSESNITTYRQVAYYTKSSSSGSSS